MICDVPWTYPRHSHLKSITLLRGYLKEEFIVHVYLFQCQRFAIGQRPGAGGEHLLPAADQSGGDDDGDEKDRRTHDSRHDPGCSSLREEASDGACQQGRDTTNQGCYYHDG